ncbi:MAG TPA: LLM class flavin-dependent oxidoreductase [Gordonia sp. (in: high G+C Gram-positive bacteria)]|uniref:LLM class flavin-dependent oxidoreductase n=1 Tax=unclassified Gordonia (in: high G+C Gram-positive bacteria) TaxID=2657482 RepID=UPI000FA79855|nr:MULTISPECIES: LLM class flavin-dependent oxidoreductase [unclassified Gordonia (in: high G+C Gram-positive bacteria)]RUP39708.1 MAG: LLM class flavin-dependent oxidoreductase [Gordonia sp. (in: high G+C Gram-positive bacteria)]HNP58060.1 LLM class flavin-dependent oxidoreductase [Gordonia sp. (in: high G+C Gram-positive bacteria)]HRC49957.1 LLM class flavin-dependent oxidoreductase [Gordonia sp. (in: high G+C Gram-positive bacteria)]
MTAEPSTAGIGVPLSILDLAQVGRGETVGESLAHSTRLAQYADTTGYHRIWYAEHHNMSAIASAAPAVLVAHMAAHTERIRLGAGGVMLPNHSPLTIAEQYGTLAELHPGRIDLGLGRAPGGDQATFAALRRTHQAADEFPRDVVELQAYLRDSSRVPGVRATPGAGTDVDLYILGSSLFGAQLAAILGLPYAFASHFAPQALTEAVALYRREFRPAPLPDGGQTQPYVIAGITAIADDDAQRAQQQRHAAKLQRIKHLVGHHRSLTDDEAQALVDSPVGRQVEEMVRYSAVGTPDDVAAKLAAFAEHADADELIVASLAPDRDVWFQTLVNLAPAASSAPTAALVR